MKRFFITLLALTAAVATMAQEARQIQVIGHRGGRYEFEENTLAAFKGSYEKGVRGYETDIRMTADGELVILHDASLKRMTDVDMDVEKSTRKEIKKVKTKQGNPILFVDELVDYFRGSDIAYIEWEMKSDNYSEEQLRVYCDKAYKMVMDGKPEGALYLFSSFDHRSLRIMKELHPDAVCMLITGDPMNEKTIETTKSLGLNRVACGVEGTSRRAMTEAHKQGLIVNLWPGGSVEDFQLALALGADIACTDYPVKVLEFVKEKMPWITPRKSLK
ncbi:MAG: glycerophosphodiester phosphodiesterase [Alistipes sp.]|nr:glycerophosphodiester phosphodiesterase [Alistipes sp.]